MPSQQRQESSKSPDRHPQAQGKPRAEHQHQRPPQESRRKRGEQRASAWGDGIDRAWCTSALTLLPESFPVESVTGVATIAPTVVDRREQMILLCNFSHSGEHTWPAVATHIQGGESPLEVEASGEES